MNEQGLSCDTGCRFVQSFKSTFKIGQNTNYQTKSIITKTIKSTGGVGAIKNDLLDIAQAIKITGGVGVITDNFQDKVFAGGYSRAQR